MDVVTSKCAELKVGSENVRFASLCLHFLALKIYRLGQSRGQEQPLRGFIVQTVVTKIVMTTMTENVINVTAEKSNNNNNNRMK